MNTDLTVNVHVREGTVFDACKVTDFVALHIDSNVGIFLFTPEQALALYKAVGDAFIILHAMQAQEDAERELSETQIDIDSLHYNEF